MKSWHAWTLAIALMVGAWFIQLVTPDENAHERSFVVEATMGERAEGRNIAATVLDIRRAASVSTASWGAVDGNWVLVDLSTSSRISPATLGAVSLIVGERTFSASERPADLDIYKHQLVADIAVTGSVAFELPADLTDGDATIRLSLIEDIRLDSVITYSFDLGEISVEPEAALLPIEWSGQ